MKDYDLNYRWVTINSFFEEQIGAEVQCRTVVPEPLAALAAGGPSFEPIDTIGVTS